ncbi:hypothetical protein SCLCIDRAFT_1097783 [Scleroderma citrinum Foug A]|uniref:Uncharacterized protein n=1 Tax=Scleroderma citrinum Foug A TaxID=1036808 RepID=A0A0C3DQI6_9AGAM|nr:hypothetical protein SCLCIDRAFT_1097783 [Scleroderma citrinum Foug A]
MKINRNLKSDARTLKAWTRGADTRFHIARVLLSLFRTQPPRDHRRQSCLEVKETTHFVDLSRYSFALAIPEKSCTVITLPGYN